MRLIEVQAAACMEVILTSDDDAKVAKARGQLAAYTDVFTLCDRVIPSYEEHYERQRNNAVKPAADQSRHWGSPNFFK